MEDDVLRVLGKSSLPSHIFDSWSSMTVASRANDFYCRRDIFEKASDGVFSGGGPSARFLRALATGSPLLGETPEECHTRVARRDHMEDIVEGRRVVSLSGGSSRSTRFNLGRLTSNRFSSFMDRTRRSDGRQRADNGTGSAGLGDDGWRRLFGLLRGRPVRHDADSRGREEKKREVSPSSLARSAASKWLARRNAALPVSATDLDTSTTVVTRDDDFGGEGGRAGRQRALTEASIDRCGPKRSPDFCPRYITHYRGRRRYMPSPLA